MFCPNCGQENPAGAAICPNCGQAAGSIAAPAPRPPAIAKPTGTRRTLALMPLWLILTVNIYWLFWLYQTYKEIRAHTPGATEITPGKAVGFLFIPVFNLYWFFRVVIDFPRAIRRMQEDDSLGEPPLNSGLITGLLIAGLVGNSFVVQIHPALLLLTEPLVIGAFFIAQVSLNAHWERHAAGALPGQRLAQPLAAAPTRELATLLGVRGPQIEWGAGAAFLVASLLADLVFLLIAPLLRGYGVSSAVGWALSFSADLFLTAAALAAFRWIRNDAAAAALAAAGYTVVQTISRLAILRLFLPQGPAWQPEFLLYSLLGNFLFLLFLALAVRGVRPLPLGLWLGATGAQLAASFVYQIGSLVALRLREDIPVSFHLNPWDILGDLAFAAVFAFAFWGGLSLLAPGVLRDS